MVSNILIHEKYLQKKEVLGIKKIVFIFFIMSVINSYAAEKIITFSNNKFDLESRFNLRDISRLSIEEAAILRNGVYAKYGYEFKKEIYKKYFGNFSWYKSKNSNVEQLLNKTDRENIENLWKYEEIKKIGVNSSEFSAYSESEYINQNGIEIRTEALENEEGNEPKKITITAGKTKEVFESLWNDGIIIGVVDFDNHDKYMDIFLSISGTDLSGTTNFYRYDGNTIVKYFTIEQSILTIYYDEKGIIYFSDWENNEGFKINKEFNYKNKAVSVIKDKEKYEKLNRLKK